MNKEEQDLPCHACNDILQTDILMKHVEEITNGKVISSFDVACNFYGDLIGCQINVLFHSVL